MNYSRINNRKKAVEFAATFALLFLILRYFFTGSAFLQNYAVLIAGILLAIGILVPTLLSPLEKGWMKLAVLIGHVMNKVILGLVFFLVLTPLSWLKRLFSGSNKGDSHWVEMEKVFDKKSMSDQF